MLRTVNALARALGFAWLGLLAFLIAPPSAPYALPVQVACYAVLGLALLAWTVLFNLHYSFGLLAFWTDQAAALQGLIYTLNMIFGGGLVPLDLFPPALRHVLLYTPFRSVIDFPVSLLAGRPGAGQIALGFVLQLLWIAVFVGLRRLLWRRGLQRYSAVGA